MIRTLLKSNTFFLIPYIIVILIIFPFLLIYSKAEIHIWINQHHSGLFDVLFPLITYLGDGLFIILPAIILLFVSLRHFVFLITAYFSTGLITQLLKRIFFEEMLRPSKYLSDKVTLHIVDGVEMLSGRSFPSGHSTSAFALFMCLALLSNNKYIKFVCFIIACMVAFSRVYLSQHFLIDITVGSIIGTIGALATYLIFYKDNRNWHTWKIQQIFKSGNKI